MRAHHTPEAESIQRKLDEWLEVEFTFIDTDTITGQLMSYPARQRALALTWIQRMSGTNVRLAEYFIARLETSFDALDIEQFSDWAGFAMDQFDLLGLNAAASALDDIDGFAAKARIRRVGAELAEHKGMLGGFLRGLSGRELNIESLGDDQTAYTNTETLFLPDVFSLFDHPRDNFLALKSTLAFLWAQTRFGSFHATVIDRLSALSLEQQHAYYCLESMRLEACLTRELPGLAREMARLSEMDGSAPARSQLDKRFPELALPGASAKLSLDRIDAFDGRSTAALPCYAGAFKLGAITSSPSGPSRRSSNGK